MIAESACENKSLGVIVLDSVNGRNQAFVAFEYASRAISKEDTRYALSKVLVKIKGESVECIGTDGYRLHIGKCEYFPNYSAIPQLPDGEYLFRVVSKNKKQIVIEHVENELFPGYQYILDGCKMTIEYETCLNGEKELSASVLTWITGEYFDSKYTSQMIVPNESFKVSVGGNRLSSASPVRLTFGNGFESVIMPATL